MLTRLPVIVIGIEHMLQLNFTLVGTLIYFTWLANEIHGIGPRSCNGIWEPVVRIHFVSYKLIISHRPQVPGIRTYARVLTSQDCGITVFGSRVDCFKVS
ncbi:hypothetical protein M426DRAFT_243614 [Hypoxylon sp. CI-4A]|nr:hypothetical protein M426DRAFT_243614 [Hypoxylon sp. CI-4A]